jgi:hypothetical protein
MAKQSFSHSNDPPLAHGVAQFEAGGGKDDDRGAVGEVAHFVALPEHGGTRYPVRAFVSEGERHIEEFELDAALTPSTESALRPASRRRPGRSTCQFTLALDARWPMRASSFRPPSARSKWLKITNRPDGRHTRSISRTTLAGSGTIFMIYRAGAPSRTRHSPASIMRRQ